MLCPRSQSLRRYIMISLVDRLQRPFPQVSRANVTRVCVVAGGLVGGASGFSADFRSGGSRFGCLAESGCGSVRHILRLPAILPAFGAPPDQESAIFALVRGIVEGCNG